MRIQTLMVKVRWYFLFLSRISVGRVICCLVLPCCPGKYSVIVMGNWADARAFGLFFLARGLFVMLRYATQILEFLNFAILTVCIIGVISVYSEGRCDATGIEMNME